MAFFFNLKASPLHFTSMKSVRLKYIFKTQCLSGLRLKGSRQPRQQVQFPMAVIKRVPLGLVRTLFLEYVSLTSTLCCPVHLLHYTTLTLKVRKSLKIFFSCLQILQKSSDFFYKSLSRTLKSGRIKTHMLIE